MTSFGPGRLEDFLRLEADWVLPIGSAPIKDGAILVDPTGRIREVGPDVQVPVPDTAKKIRFEKSAILPGLINAHTHLELTGLAGVIDVPDFPDWIRSVRRVKAQRPPEDFLEASRRGIREALAAGITTVLDTGDSGAVLPALAEIGGSGIVYQEVFGPHPDDSSAQIAALERRIEALTAHQTDRARLGLSPHAPYTVSGPLYRATGSLARRLGFPLAVHLAESRAETALVTRGEGSFAEAWRLRGIPPLASQVADQSLLRSPVSWLDANGVLTEDTLVIHAVQLDDEDLGLLGRRGVTIAHCPRSNRLHGHGDARLQEMLSAGLPVAVGTDSVISVGDLDMFAELREARALADLNAREALSLATSAAGQALGRDDLGAIAPGFWADLVAIRLPDEPTSANVEESVLRIGTEGIQSTFLAGYQIHNKNR